MSKARIYANVSENIRTALMAAGTGIGGFTAYQVYQGNKRKKDEDLKERYLRSMINPRTMKVELVPELTDSTKPNIASFAIAPLAAMGGALLLESAAFVGLDRAIDHYTSPEHKAKKKIKEKYTNAYKKWALKREDDYNKGLISGDEFDAEKARMKQKAKISAAKEYKYWKEREEFIKDAAREHYDNLQKKVPQNDNFALFKDNPPVNHHPPFPQTNNVNIAPSVFDFIKLDIARGVAGAGNNLIKNFVLKEDKILTAVKKLLLTEFEIDSMKNVSEEKKDLLKFEAFKVVLSQFSNPADVDKVFALKAKFEEKVNKNKKPQNFNKPAKGKSVNFEDVIDSADFDGWKPSSEIEK